jgi:hypothetical protein
MPGNIECTDATTADTTHRAPGGICGKSNARLILDIGQCFADEKVTKVWCYRVVFVTALIWAYASIVRVGCCSRIDKDGNSRLDLSRCQQLSSTMVARIWPLRPRYPAPSLNMITGDESPAPGGTYAHISRVVPAKICVSCQSLNVVTVPAGTSSRE